MDPTILTGIVAAVVAGATAKAQDLGSDLVKDTYEGLKALIVRKLKGKTGAVQSVEDEPESEPAQANLAIAISKTDAIEDPQVKQLAERLRQALAAQDGDHGQGAGDIDISSITAGIDANIRGLIARGSIRIRDIKAEGTVNVIGVATVAPPPAGDPKPKNS
jgi:disulfide oxidoreductase YuzD